MLVILNVSTGPKETGVMAGIAVGGIIGLEAMFAGPICGIDEPARCLALPSFRAKSRPSGSISASPVGAAAAVPLWMLVRPCNVR